MKQTAVDWAFNQLDEQVYKVDYETRRINISISFEDMMTLKKEAKEIEKDQIKEAYKDGSRDLEIQYSDVGEINSEEYYNETYGKDA
jgi:hypothetical protein